MGGQEPGPQGTVETYIAEEEIVSRLHSLFVRLLESEGKHDEPRIGNEAIKALVYFHYYRQWDAQGKEKTSEVASTICMRGVNIGIEAAENNTPSG